MQAPNEEKIHCLIGEYKCWMTQSPNDMQIWKLLNGDQNDTCCEINGQSKLIMGNVHIAYTKIFLHKATEKMVLCQVFLFSGNSIGGEIWIFFVCDDGQRKKRRTL